jgi:hypothetical protein
MKIFLFATIVLLAGTMAAQDAPATNSQSPQPLSPSFVKAAKRAMKAIDSDYCQAARAASVAQGEVCQEIQKYIDDASVEANTVAERITMTVIETYSIKMSAMYLARTLNPPQYQQLREETNRCSQVIDKTLKSATYDPSITCK